MGVNPWINKTSNARTCPRQCPSLDIECSVLCHAVASGEAGLIYKELGAGYLSRHRNDGGSLQTFAPYKKGTVKNCMKNIFPSSY